MHTWEKVKYFTYYYLTDHIVQDFSSMHDEWFQKTQDKYAALAAPRGFAKSHIFSFFYPLYIALTEPGSDILLISSTEDLAAQFLAKISTELEDNQQLIADFGLQKKPGAKWTTTHKDLANGSRILAKGAQSKVRGARTRLVVVDDIENDENVLSDDFRTKTREWLFKAVMGTMIPTGQLLVVGTILHPLSVLNGLLEDKMLSDSWTQSKYTALITNEHGEEVSAWPTQYPTPWLLEKRAMSPEAFQQEYMNDPVPDELKVFHKKDIVYYEKLPTNLSITTTMDPAGKTRKTSDYTAIVTVGTDEDYNMYVLEVTRSRMTPEKMVSELYRHYETYNPHRIGVEDFGFLEFYINYEAKRRGLFLPFDPIKIDTSPKAKRSRIQALQPHFSRGMVYLKQNQTDLITEILTFPAGSNDDALDALAYHLKLINPAKKTRPTIDKSSVEYYLNKKRNLAKKSNRRGWHI